MKMSGRKLTRPPEEFTETTLNQLRPAPYRVGGEGGSGIIAPIGAIEGGKQPLERVLKHLPKMKTVLKK